MKKIVARWVRDETWPRRVFGMFVVGLGLVMLGGWFVVCYEQDAQAAKGHRGEVWGIVQALRWPGYSTCAIVVGLGAVVLGWPSPSEEVMRARWARRLKKTK